MIRRGKSAEEGISSLLDELGDALRGMQGSSLDANDDSETDRLSRIADCESSAEGVLDEFSQTQATVTEPCSSKDMKEMWFLIHLVIQQEGLHHVRFRDKNVDHPPFAKKGRCLWTELGYKWRNAESRCVCKR